MNGGGKQMSVGQIISHISRKCTGAAAECTEMRNNIKNAIKENHIVDSWNNEYIYFI